MGDSLASDMAMGRELGLTTVLVLTGVTDRGALHGFPLRPDYVIERLSDLPSLLVQERDTPKGAGRAGSPTGALTLRRHASRLMQRSRLVCSTPLRR